MLIRFEVANFRSILDAVELSMVAVDRDRAEARPVENLGESLLAVAAIYGSNASGKTNVLAALSWLRTAVEESLRSWDDEIPVEPFAFADGHDRVSEFTVEMVVDGVRFEYLVELDREAVRYEGLFHYPEKKRRRVFEREGRTLKLQRGLGGISGTRELLTPRSLVLSIARRFDEPVVAGFTRSLLGAETIAQSTTGHPAWKVDRSRLTVEWFDGPAGRDRATALEPEPAGDRAPDDRARALALLRLADLGIEDVIVERPAVDAASGRRPSGLKLQLVHRSGAGGGTPLSFVAESEGTRRWFMLIGPLLGALDRGSLLLFDELDASLHPILSAEMLRLFHDPTTNPRGAQLIFTTHDTSLLNHLNRDEVWLTEKDAKGVTRLGALAEFRGARVRRSQNLERAYLHGRFGALPDVDRTEILRALGLTG